MDTIFALSTARGRAALAVVRVSGPLAEDAGRSLAGPLPPPRVAGLRRLAWRGDALDEGLVLWFEPGRSYTGEALVELHLHGGRAVVDRVLDVLAGMPGLRLAEPGEFTRRALEAGRLDLEKVEAIADLIDAETESQRRQAVREMSGTLARRAAEWRADLVRAEALLAAEIDFADEDIPGGQQAEAAQIVDRLVGDWRREIAGAAAAERVRDGFEVAIIGATNAGKSTLLNAMAGRDAAITSPRPGTTRDVIEVRMDLGGLAVTLLDTAGLRMAADEIEAEGVRRAQERAAAADLRVFLLDGSGMPPGVPAGPEDIVVSGKCDLSGDGSGVSGLTGAGVPDLLARIGTVLAGRAQAVGAVTRLRHRQELVRGIESLEMARKMLSAGGQAELVAENLRTARQRVASLVGKVDVEAILGEVFARFCIGK